MGYWQGKVAIVAGASAGLGRVIAGELLQQAASVVAIARDAERLQVAFTDQPGVTLCAADMTSDADVTEAVATAQQTYGRIDAVFHCVGKSHREEIQSLTAATAEEYLQMNFLTAVRMTQQAIPYLLQSKGHNVLIGSLAAKIASGYLGAYPASKFPLVAYAQQLRIELGSKGLHTLLVCPGPIAREDAGRRYVELAANIPDAARQPAGGAKLKGVAPQWLARRILRACEKRKTELVVPRKAKLLFAINQLCPTVGDWIIKKETS